MEVPVLVHALRGKDVALQMAKEQMMFMHEEARRKREEASELMEKLRKMKEMMDSKEFFL